jgi:hypothetical protein
MQPLAVALDSISIETQLVERNRTLADFYHRRSLGQGSFFTKKQIAERNPMLTSDLLRTVPGIEIVCEGIGSCAPATLRRYGLEAHKGYCKLQVILNGQPSGIIPDDIPPAWIAGIEVYKGSAQGPTEFGATGKNRTMRNGADVFSMDQRPAEKDEPFCGTVAIWTGGERE